MERKKRKMEQLNSQSEPQGSLWVLADVALNEEAADPAEFAENSGDVFPTLYTNFDSAVATHDYVELLLSPEGFEHTYAFPSLPEENFPSVSSRISNEVGTSSSPTSIFTSLEKISSLDEILHSRQKQNIFEEIISDFDLNSSANELNFDLIECIDASSAADLEKILSPLERGTVSKSFPSKIFDSGTVSSSKILQIPGKLLKCEWKNCDAKFDEKSKENFFLHVKEKHFNVISTNGKNFNEISKEEKNFVCRWKNCRRKGKNFTSKSKFFSHLFSHIEENPFVCEICAARFRSEAEIQIHIREHNGAKPYQCKFCPKSYSHRSDLWLHVKMKHSENSIGSKSEKLESPAKFRCPSCPKEFALLSSLRLHKKNFHSNLKKNEKKMKKIFHPPPEKIFLLKVEMKKKEKTLDFSSFPVKIL